MPLTANTIAIPEIAVSKMEVIAVQLERVGAIPRGFADLIEDQPEAFRFFVREVMRDLLLVGA